MLTESDGNDSEITASITKQWQPMTANGGVECQPLMAV
jgi:hypothetical protein